MKRIGLFILATTLLCSCKQEIAGTIELKGRRPVRLWNEAGVAVDIRSGPTKIQIDSKGWFFDSKFTVETSKGKWTIAVPKSAYFNDTDFSLEESVDTQPVNIRGKKVTDLIESHTEIGVISCTGSGFCNHSETTTDSNGHIKTTMEWGYSSSCPGSQSVRNRVDTYIDHFEAIFTTRALNYGEIGKFKGQGAPYSKRYVEEYLSGCNT